MFNCSKTWKSAVLLRMQIYINSAKAMPSSNFETTYPSLIARCYRENASGLFSSNPQGIAVEHKKVLLYSQTCFIFPKFSGQGTIPKKLISDLLNCCSFFDSSGATKIFVGLVSFLERMKWKRNGITPKIQHLEQMME